MKRTIIFLFWALFLLVAACSSFRQKSLSSSDPESARQVYEIRQGTQKYLDIERARADGYLRTSGYIPNMGYQFANPKFFSTDGKYDLRRPPILLYDEREGNWELIGVGFGVGMDKNPKQVLPFRQAEYLKRASACHYTDGTTIPSDSIDGCPKEHPLTHTPMEWWHGNIWVMSAWVWYPNPNGVFSLYNPLLQIPIAP
jgi:hypothetical protein